MKKIKAVGIALIIVGLVFGIEGTAMAYLGVQVLGELNSGLAGMSVYGSEAEALGLKEAYQFFQGIFTAITAYSMVKTLAGIACIILGYFALTKEKD
ncbi:MAG: hypothetical protein QXK06_00180 [Candidatus Diapherotrites archaeon]